MSQKERSKIDVIDLKSRRTDVSWEHEDKAVYTVEALQREIKSKLAPKQTDRKKKSAS